MASMQIEVVASSSPFSYVSLRDHKRFTNIMGYINSQSVRKNKTKEHDERGDQNEDSSWLPSQSSETDNSWLPIIGHDSIVTSESKGSGHGKGGNNVDDSWLPADHESNGKCGTNTNELENDVDYSWLPSTFIDINKNKLKNEIIGKNTTTKTKPKNTNTSINRNNKNKSSINNNNSNSNSNSGTNSSSSSHKKSRNDHWALARKVVFSCDQQNENVDSLHHQQDYTLKSRYIVESQTSGGVSSLLQRWKDLAEVKNVNEDEESSSNNHNSSVSTCNENKHDNDSHGPPSSTTIEESDKASRSRRLSCPLPSRDSNDSNPGGAEKEKIRVVDIIKKLSREEELAASHASGHGLQSLPQVRTTLHNKQTEGEHKGIKNIKVSRHLIRGRQAYNNFVMQMEQDKRHELKWLVDRKAVSKFSHQGRIKSVLRFKILRLGAEAKQESKLDWDRVSKTMESKNNRLDLMDRRERFNSGKEKGATESRKNISRNDLNNITNEESPATASTTSMEVETNTKTKTTTNIKKQEPQPKPEPMNPNQSTQHSTNSCKDVHKAEFEDSCSSPINHKEDHQNKDDHTKYDYHHEDEGQFMSAKTSYGSIEDRDRRMQALESFQDWMSSDDSQIHSDLDEDESYDMQLFDTDYDWISGISRPKSDWEDMRQARYQEMLQDSSGHIDIQRLLERKSVSGFLGSGMRDLIDQLMVSRIQQPHALTEKQDILVRPKEDSRKDVEQEDHSMVDDDEDHRSRTETKCNEYNEYVDQTTFSERSWRPNDVVCSPETTTTTSPSIKQSLSFNRSHNVGTPESSSSVPHQTIEMELIYDLRGHMEKLQNEIMELRKSIKSCVNMQVKLQHSYKQYVVTPETLPVQSKEEVVPGIVKQDCSICYDMQVDSLLYRCGHMCTCFKCALELQRTSEQCPVCEAPIVDVVKAMCS